MAWERWVPRWRNAIAACERLGGDTVRLQVGPPASSQQVEAVERAMDRPLPEDLRRVLLEFSGAVEFFWFLPSRLTPPAPLDGIFCGECHWDVAELIRLDQELTWLVEHCFDEDDPGHRLWRNKLAFQSIGNGDFLAIDTERAAPQPVVYLNHELGDSHGCRLAPNFIEFIDRWTRLGCPSDDVFPRFVPDCEGYLDPSFERAKRWCAWFGLPDPEAA